MVEEVVVAATVCPGLVVLSAWGNGCSFPSYAQCSSLRCRHACWPLPHARATYGGPTGIRPSAARRFQRGGGGTQPGKQACLALRSTRRAYDRL